MPEAGTERFADATTGIRIALWKWGIAVKTNPRRLAPYPITIHFEEVDR